MIRRLLAISPAFVAAAVSVTIALSVVGAPQPATTVRQTATVVDVIDGDTIVANIAGTAKRVRILGYNAPEEGWCYAEKASQRLRSLVGGKTVTLETEGDSDDLYGRLLRHVFVGDALIDEQMASEGYGFAEYKAGKRNYALEIRRAENDARANKRGMWRACFVPDSFRIVSVTKTAERVDLRNSGRKRSVLGYTLISISGRQEFDFPSVSPARGQKVIVRGGNAGATAGRAPMVLTWRGDHWANADRDPALLVRPDGKWASYWSDAMPPEPLEPTPTVSSTKTASPTVTPTSTPGPNCDPSYPTVCIPPPPPDLNCDDISFRNFKVVPPDPHGFDSDNDGVGCET